MAEPTPPTPSEPDGPSGGREPGARIARDEIDLELVKLARQRPQIGVITAAGVVFLCIVLLLRIAPDRRFAGSGDQPVSATPADILEGKVELDRLVRVTAEPLVAQAIRTTKTRGTLGRRLVPARGTADRLWLVVAGDGDEPPRIPVSSGYVGRLRKLGDLPLAEATRLYADAHPRPVFAAAPAVRAAFASGRVATVGGDTIALRDDDAIALDVVDANAATVAAVFNDKLPDTAAWRAALEAAGITATTAGAPDTAVGQIRFTVAASAAATTARLEAAKLFDARVEPVNHHYRTTWAALRKSSPAGLDVGGAILPDDQIDLIGLYAIHGIPDDAYAVVTGESPQDYWYVLPITIALAAILLVFAWALVRAVRRDLLPARSR